jgi:hypothetical protein
MSVPGIAFLISANAVERLESYILSLVNNLFQSRYSHLNIIAVHGTSSCIIRSKPETHLGAIV